MKFPISLRGAVLLGYYLALGAFAHLTFVGRVFQVDDMASWAWLLAWPVGILFKILAVLPIIVLVLLDVIGLVVVVQWLRHELVKHAGRTFR